jgi:hypothetical protein
MDEDQDKKERRCRAHGHWCTSGAIGSANVGP